VQVLDRAMAATTNGGDAPTSDLKYLMVPKASVSDPSTQAEWAKKRLVWVPHERDGFVQGSIKEDRGDEAIVEVSESNKQVCSIFYQTNAKLLGVQCFTVLCFCVIYSTQ
jgi:hypothetical protein